MTEQNKALVCAICGATNEPEATICVRCHAALVAGTTTVNVPEDVAHLDGSTQHLSPLHQHGMSNDGLILYFAGEVRPVIVRGRKEVILGRKVEADADVLDTMPYNGHLLGVSRRHTLLRITDDGYMVEDLGSTNGTWLNEKRLPAHTPYIVHNGDQLRLGQLILFVYFASSSTKQQVTLKTTETATALMTPQKITAPYLATHVSPYLDAIIGIQQVINGLLEREAEKGAVQAINVNAEKSSIVVDIEGVMDSVQLVQDVVIPWRRRNRTVVAQFRAVAANGVPDDGEALMASLRESQVALAQEVIAEVAAHASRFADQDFSETINQLIPHLEVLTASTLEITRSSY